MNVHFTKMHGAGNDYIYVNTLLYSIPDPASASIKWSKPHFGIGSDGLILIGEATDPDADFSMRIFNNDGSEAMMCGNGTRCVAKFLHDKGMTTKNPIRLQTRAGIKILHLHVDEQNLVDQVTVDMGAPILYDAEQFAAPREKSIDYALTYDDKTYYGTFVSMGNPHFVIFLNEDVEKFPLAEVGSLFEYHPVFPQRCNIEFVQVLQDGSFRMRVWERGSGITMACGTGACATAVAAHLTGRSGQESIIRMDGGALKIQWKEEDGHVYMTGPAATVFEGEISL